MSVLALMYHRTPQGSADDFYDVPLARFREQIDRMIDEGVPFIRFSDVNADENLGREPRVAITFDDGHASNAAAFAFLADRSIVPAAMIVRDWSARDAAHLSARAIADLAPICEFGGHGASHRSLASLDAQTLDDELVASRDYLAAALGSPPRFMALPGGKGNSLVFRAAERAGFAIVGNSRPLRHERRSVSVDRVCVTRASEATEPLRLAKAGSAFWLRRRARRAASQLGSRLLGGDAYARLARLVK